MKKDMWEISNSILSTADDLAIEAVREAEAECEIFEDTWGDYVYENVFAKNELKGSRQVEFVRIESIAGVYMYYMGVDNSTHCRLIDVRFSGKRFVPESLPPEVSHLVDVDRWGIYKTLTLRDHPVWEEMKNELVAVNKTYEKAVNFYKSFMDFVEAVVDQYDTVNEAVAAWPAFRYLLPEWLRNEEFPFEGGPRPLPEYVDVAKVTALIARAKLEV